VSAAVPGPGGRGLRWGGGERRSGIGEASLEKVCVVVVGLGIGRLEWSFGMRDAFVGVFVGLVCCKLAMFLGVWRWKFIEMFSG
jgi:hypothetical protein